MQYSQQLQNYIQQAGHISGLNPERINLLAQSMSSYLSVFAQNINARLDSSNSDPLSTALMLLSLSIALSETKIDSEIEGIHYLVAMGFEQSGELSARQNAQKYTNYPPLKNDHWYRLALAFLHYMAGGFRVQAISVLRHLQKIRDEIKTGEWQHEYTDATNNFWSLFRGRDVSKPTTRWENILFGQKETDDIQEKRLFHLSQQIRDRRRIALTDLGLANEFEWLRKLGVTDENAIPFWEKYLENLERRGYTNFTEEQIGPGFDRWLAPNTDLLAVLPTGSGKTIIGELKTALTLAQGGQSIWITPMRVLIRQVKKDFKKAFRDTGVKVEELPVTEDLIPLIVDLFPQNKTVAVTTPEKLAVLMRNKPDAVRNIKLAVLDEAQIIFDLNRGATIEYVLQELNRIAPECSFVLLSAFADKREKLNIFMNRLRKKGPVELTSDNRPTRRIYGVITNYSDVGFNKPTIQIFPAGIQTQNPNLKSPISINLNQTLPQSKVTDIELAQSIVKPLVSTNIRSVMFVNYRSSANAQTRQIASSIENSGILPELDVARLRIELGRPSVIETTASKGVAPHHAGLSKLEQYFVEKWIQDQVINLVVATPTLAQGVNLPFDVSILTFLKRQNQKEKKSEPLSVSEILNMIGRAGRAGYVSDGMCLISMKSSARKKPVDTLNSTRKYFFHRILPDQEFIGLSRLLQLAKKAHISRPDWVYELSNLELPEAQSLTSFALGAIQNQDIKSGLLSRLSMFPSMQDMQADQAEIVNQLELLAQNIINQTENDANLLEATTRTGMPIELLKYYFSALKQKNLQSDNLFDRVDEIVHNALDESRNRGWFSTLFNKKELDEVFIVIKKWRNGETVNEIESNVNWGKSENLKQININGFLNHDISQFAQFWGAFAVCAEYVLESSPLRNQFSRFQTFVREGVSNILELEWLNRLGGLDRVLSHHIAAKIDTSFIVDEQNPGGFVQQQIESWQKKESLIPIDITDIDLMALRGALNDLD